ncbi:MAG: beta-N-acetylglucosaminidase domain-containing protein [Clostridium sp.]|nr:beta-N-acetylglucosaminidase domain-containing protein [Clostridium sp.]
MKKTFRRIFLLGAMTMAGAAVYARQELPASVVSMAYDAVTVASGVSSSDVVLSPVPQRVEWGDWAFDRSTFTFKLSGRLDETTRALLTDRFRIGGRGDRNVPIILGRRGDKAVRRWKKHIPEHAEGYYLCVEPNRIVVAGHDDAGLYYGVQTLLQVTANPRVRSVTVTDWPMTAVRGVIEGFYGNPWSFEDRLSQFRFCGANKMNIYIYGPKDDVYHHRRWYEPYPEAEAERMRQLVKAAADHRVKFVWAMHPSNSIVSEADRKRALEKFEQMYNLGVRAFAIFFDDISAKSVNDQVAYLNFLTDEFVDSKGDVEPMIVCPTQYNKAWSGGDYLSTMGMQLYPDIRIMWTGNSVCDMIQREDADWFTEQTGRKPFIWLNYPVNDYGQHNLLMGPLVDNGTDVYDRVSAFCSNPMQYAEASKVVLYSIADYAWNPSAFEPFAAWERAIRTLMPGHEEAFGRFCRSNVDVAPNTHALRVLHETPEFEALTRLYPEIEGLNARGAYNEYFSVSLAAAEELIGLKGQSPLVDEISEFVECYGLQARRGQLMTDMARALEVVDPASQQQGDAEAFIRAYTEYKALTDEASRLVSRGFEGSIQSVQPHTATLHVEPFIKRTVQTLVERFKATGAEYPEGLFPDMVLESGTYFIKSGGRFLTNVDGSQEPTWVAAPDTINEGRQRWIITFEGAVERYSIRNEWDKRYVNEVCRFGRNAYDENWNTYVLTCAADGRFSIRNAGNGGSAYWLPEGNRLGRESKPAEAEVFEIILVGGAN